MTEFLNTDPDIMVDLENILNCNICVCEEFGESSELWIDRGIEPNAFVFMANIVHNTIESLRLHYDKWDDIYSKEERSNSLRPILVDKLVYIQTNCLIRLLSTIEYNFKNHLRNQKEISPRLKKVVNRKFVSYKTLMDALRVESILSGPNYELLVGAGFLRNDFVHNHAISDRTDTIKIGPIASIERIEGHAIEADLADFSVLFMYLKRPVDEYYFNTEK